MTEFGSFRIVSFNLLVPKFAERPNYYVHSDPQHLNTKYRWESIRQEIEYEILNNKNTIVCLQEVSKTLLERLIILFKALDYKLIECLYGGPGDDFMGVAIAIPNSIPIEWIKRVHIGKELQAIQRTKIKRFKLLRSIFFCQSKTEQTQPNKIWKNAVRRRNHLILMHLKVDDRDLYIGTYHMPCAYKQPDIMLLHAAFVKDYIFHESRGKPFILAGDFNLSPRDVAYQYIIGQLPTAFDHLLDDFPFKYQPVHYQILKSAYREKIGKEPNFTNYVHTAGSELFCATLDYIFFAGRLKVTKIKETPYSPTGKSYPDESHPSDHLMIAANFVFED